MLGFFTKNNNEIDGEWRTVAELKVGQSIAVPKEDILNMHSAGKIDSREWMDENDVVWDEIESIEYVGTEQVWDIEVEGTHNFVGNNIFAHNTYITGNVGAGTSTPYAALSAAVGTSGTAIAADAMSGFIGNLIELKVASTTKFLVNQDGNVGIGTTSPGVKLSVDGAGLFNSGITSYGRLNIPSFTATSTTATSTIAGFLDVTGTGANATSTFSSNLWVKGSLQIGGGSIHITTNSVSSTDGALALSSVGNSNITNQITFGGKVLMTGLSSDALTIGIPGVMCLSSGNEVLKLSGVSTCIVSSARFKHDISTSTVGLDLINALRPVTFTYNNDTIGMGQQFGFIAEDVQKLDPRLVVHDANGLPYSVRYENLTAVLATAIQELSSSVSGQQKQIDPLHYGIGINPAFGTSTPAITIDVNGDAFFKGQVTAGGFNVRDIGTSLANLNQISSSTSLTLESLANSLNILTSSLASTTASITSTTDKLAFDFAELNDRLRVLETASSTDISLLFKNPEGLTISAPLTLMAGLKVDQISSVSDYLSLLSDTEFIGRPYFTKDTAGFAVIKTGSREVQVVFDREYLEQPIVNTTISFELASSSISSIPASGNNIEEQIFTNDVRFLITNKSEKGFTILLNKPAPTDVPFSWTALAVKSAKVFSSVPVPAEIPSTITIIPVVVPEVAGASTTPDNTQPSQNATAGEAGQVAGAATSTPDVATSTPPVIEPIATSTPPVVIESTASTTPL